MVKRQKLNKKKKKLPQLKAKKELSAETGKLVEETVKAIVKDKKGSKKHEYFLYRHFGYPVKVAAKLSGYHRGSGARLESRYRNDTAFRAEIDRISAPAPGQYMAWAKLKLPMVSRIENAALDEMLSDPSMAIRHPKLLRDLKQASGVDLKENPKSVQQTVNIGKIQTVLQNVLDSDIDSPGIVEGEIIVPEIEEE